MDEDEWGDELANNVDALFENGGGDAKCLTVNGDSVRKCHNKVILFGDSTFYTESIVDSEIYDCETQSVSLGPNTTMPVFGAAVANLPTGDVALFGGKLKLDFDGAVISRIEVVNTNDGSSSVVGNMNTRRHCAAAVLLRSGLVFVVGGFDNLWWLSSCELYDPVRKTCTNSRASMELRRRNHTASLLPDGSVLVCGGPSVTAIHATPRFTILLLIVSQKAQT